MARTLALLACFAATAAGCQNYDKPRNLRNKPRPNLSQFDPEEQEAPRPQPVQHPAGRPRGRPVDRPEPQHAARLVAPGVRTGGKRGHGRRVFGSRGAPACRGGGRVPRMTAAPADRTGAEPR